MVMALFITFAEFSYYYYYEINSYVIVTCAITHDNIFLESGVVYILMEVSFDGVAFCSELFCWLQVGP